MRVRMLTHDATDCVVHDEAFVHECSIQGLVGGQMIDDVFYCAHGYVAPEGAAIRTRYGAYRVGKTVSTDAGGTRP